MFQRMNFCGKWIKGIKGCLELSFISLLVNGSPTQPFSSFKGLRQGGPLAHFFIYYCG